MTALTYEEARDLTSTASPAPARKTRVQRAGSAIITVVMVVFLALAGSVIVAPRLLGAVPLTVLTGSMQPALSPGDLIVVRPTDPQALAVGDVITFQPISDDPTLVTHRIVTLDFGPDGYVTSVTTRGDANSGNDQPIVPAQVMGRLVYSLPWVGHLTQPSRGAAALVTIAGAGLLAYALVLMFLPDKDQDR